MRKSFDDALRERLMDYKEDPDDGLWNRISLHATRLPVWINWAHSVAILTVVMTIGMSLYVIQFPFTQEKPYEDRHSSREQLQPNVITKDDESTKQMLQHEDVHSMAIAVQKKSKAIDLLMGVVETSYNESGIIIITDEKEVVGIENENTVRATVRENYNDDDKHQFQPSSTQDIRGDSTEANSENGAELLSETENKLDEENEKVNIKKGTLYFLAIPVLNYNRITPHKTDDIYVEEIKRVPGLSTTRLGIRVEAGFEYPLGVRTNIYGGILYYQRKQTIGYTERIVDSVSIVPVNGLDVSLLPHFKYEQKSISHEIRNLGLHAGINYRLRQQKFLHFIGTGVELHKSLTALPSMEAGESINRPVFIFFSTYYRLQYPSEGRLKAVFQPTVNYSVYLNEQLRAPFYVKPFGLGLNIGLTYKF